MPQIIFLTLVGSYLYFGDTLTSLVFAQKQKINNNTLYHGYMNGRLKKIDMTARLNGMKSGLANESWYPEWDARQRGAAQRILNNALEVLDEYDY